MRCSLIALLALPLVPTSVRQDDLTERLTALAAAPLEDGRLHGLALRIDLGGETLFEGAFGRRPFDESGPARVEGVTPAACLMDLFTALVALQRVDEGEVEPDAPLAKVVPGLAWEGHEVSLHHLLTHTSGVPEYEEVEPELRVVQALFRRDDAWKGLAQGHLENAPGDCQTFRGTNTYLVGEILEALDDRPLPAQLQARLFGPLGMTSTGHRAEAAERLEGPGCSVSFGGASAFDPSGAARFRAAELVTNVPDLVRLVRGLVERRVLSRRAAAHLFGTHRLDDGQVLRHAHGLSTITLDAFEGFAFGGASGTDRVHVMHLAELDLTIAAVADGADGVLPALADRLAREVFDLPLTRVTDRALPEGALEGYLGTFRIGCDRLVLRAADAGHLVLVSAGRPDLVLWFQGDHRFVARDDPSIALAFQVEAGRARSFVFTERGAEGVAVRFDD